MVKIKKSQISLLAFFIIALVTISSCSKPECKTSADCSSRKCTLSKCENSKCVYTLQQNCCGNRINESIEDGKPGSKCTCPLDYGKCEGKGKIKVGSRTEDAVYAHYYCNVDNSCVLGVERKDAVQQNYLDSIDTGFFKASSVVKYNKPFEVSRDIFELKINLDDASKDLVFPVLLAKVKLLYSSEYARNELLIAEQDLSNVLNGIGDQAIINVPLNLNYKPQELEEVGSLRYTIDYTYTKQVVTGRTANGTNKYSPETKRETFKAPTKQVFFVRSG